MKIVLAGGGTGGHFTPLIAVAEEINRIAEEQRLVDIKLYFVSDRPYDERALLENHIEFKKIEAGKRRAYFSILNYFDIFKTAFGVMRAVLKMFALYPDVVFSKGGYAAFPVLFAAKILRIPVVMHESDSVPGRVNAWTGKFAQKIGIAFPEAANHFPKEKTALVGVPIRRELLQPLTANARNLLSLEQDLPILLVIGGSLGSQTINDVVLDIAPRLVEKYQVIHQVGRNNHKEAAGRLQVILQGSQHKDRYKMYDYLDESALRLAAGVAELAVARAGATSIFELAHWGIPAILIPIAVTPGDHQRENAFAYARAKAGIVIEEKNLTPNLLFGEIERLFSKPDERIKMKEGAKAFALPDAARKLAEEIISIGLSHE